MWKKKKPTTTTYSIRDRPFCAFCRHVAASVININATRPGRRGSGGRVPAIRRRDGTSFRNIKTRYLRPSSRRGVHLSFKGFSLLLYSRSHKPYTRPSVTGYTLFFSFFFLRRLLSDGRARERERGRDARTAHHLTPGVVTGVPSTASKKTVPPRPD